MAGLAGLGLTPVLALQVTDSGRRLDHIRELLRNCAFSLHDLHEVSTERWNMILELGMAIECSPEHAWFVLDSEPRRAIRALSDLNGTDIFAHKGTPRGVLGALLNIFSRTSRNLTVRRLETIHKELTRRERHIMVHQRAASAFEPRIFLSLVDEAARLAQEKMSR